MLTGKTIDTFEFDDELIFDYEVGDVFTDALTLIGNWIHNLRP
jgi:hypothetical protein